MKKSLLISVCVLFLTLFSATYALCVTFDLSGDRKLHLTGHIDQYFRYGFKNDPENLAGGGKAGGAYRGLSEALYSILFEQHYKHSEVFEFRSGLRLEGDWAYNINQHVLSSDHWGGPSGLDQSEDLMKRHSHNAQRDVLREFNVGINTRHFNARIGKQTVVWGETDLFRLMDMFNPLDYQRMYVMRDADYGYEETRIPLWSVKLGVTPEVNIGPLSDIQVEFAWTPEVRQTLLNVGPRNGGVWAVPIPSNMPDLTGLGLGPLKDLDLGPDDDHGGRAQTLENATYGFRVRGNWGNTYFTLNGFYAWDEFPIIQTRPGFQSNLGPGGLGVLYMVDPDDIVPDAIVAPYGGNNVDDGFGYGMALDKKLYRKQVLGFTLAREMDFLRSFVQAIGQVANPTVRIESYYQFRKHISTNWAEKIKRGVATGNLGLVAEGVADGKDGYEKKDTLRYMVGFDWPLRIRAL